MPFSRFLHLFVWPEARAFVYILILALYRLFCLTKMLKTKFSSPKEKEHLLGLSILLPPKATPKAAITFHPEPFSLVYVVWFYRLASTADTKAR